MHAAPGAQTSRSRRRTVAHVGATRALTRHYGRVCVPDLDLHKLGPAALALRDRSHTVPFLLGSSALRVAAGCQVAGTYGFAALRLPSLDQGPSRAEQLRRLRPCWTDPVSGNNRIHVRGFVSLFRPAFRQLGGLSQKTRDKGRKKTLPARAQTRAIETKLARRQPSRLKARTDRGRVAPRPRFGAILPWPLVPSDGEAVWTPRRHLVLARKRPSKS